MTLRELIDKETKKTLKEIENKTKFIGDCRFFVIAVNDEDSHRTISNNLDNLEISREIGYSDGLCGYIWLRWNMNLNKFISYLNYDYDGNDCGAPLYDSSDIITVGQFLTMKARNEIKNSKEEGKD